MFLVNQIAAFYKLVVLLLLGVARRIHSAQNNKIVISWQFLKKKGRDEVHVLHVNQHHTILKTDIINLKCALPDLLEVPKITLQNLCNIVRKKWGMKFIFV